MQKSSPSTSNHHTLPFPTTHDDAGAPDSAAASSAESPGAPAGSPKRGRPSGYAPKVVEMICEPIRTLGYSDSAAAVFVGMSSSSLSRWKHDHPELRQKLKQAREECRRQHIERLERFADGTGAVALRAATWLAERLFPGDYAKTARERWAWQTFEEQRDQNEEREVGNEIWAEKEAARGAEVRAQQAAEAEAAKVAATSESDSRNVQNSSGPAGPGVAEPSSQATFFSVGDSHYVQNSPAAGSPAEAEAPADAAGSSSAPGGPEAVERAPSATFSSEDDSHNVQKAGKPNVGPLMEALFGPSVSDPHHLQSSPAGGSR